MKLRTQHTALSTRAKALRIATLIIWLLLFGALLNRDYFVRSLETRETAALQRDREESYQGIHFQGERIGYVRSRLTDTGANQVTLFQDAYLLLNILDETHPVDMRVKAILNRELLLREFVFHFSSPFYRMEASGTVQGRRVDLTLSTGKETITDTIQLSRQPYLSTSRRAYLLDQGLEAGDKIKVPYFDPVSLSGKDTVMEYKGREKMVIRGRIYNLHHFEESFSGLKIDSWLDDRGNVIKEESPAGFVFIAEPEFVATDLSRGTKEILSSVSVPPEGGMPDLTDRRRLQYRLTLPEGVEFDLDGGRQSLDGKILTIVRETIPPADARSCGDREEELASTPYIQAGNKRIAELSRSLAGDLDHPLAKVRILAGWVYENLEKRPVLGIPDALTTLNTGIGDCNEHAALFAALARNAGIPTRIAAGVTFFEEAFYYHAWNEVCLDDQWLTVDTTRNQIPADLTHIKFVEGETSEQVKIGSLLGKLGMEIVDKQ